jgi:exodeoxyribonuclease VII large subunit
MNPEAARDEILSVGSLTRRIKAAVDEAFPAVWVRGEMSGVKRAPSGHVYFSLKEGTEAVIECALWSRYAPRVTFDLRDGVEVEAFGSVTVYPPRGRYQLNVQDMRPAGLGALLLKLEELKRRLQAEGLFDPARKRPLPRYPRAIGLVTSPSGAAVRDMIKVLRARWPSIRIVLAPVRVQGEGAAGEIAAAVRRFGRYGGVDVLIVGRGGGSLEDLWAFNEEIAIRAVAESPIPVIAGIGHEVDQTLVELAADVRAATPSNAAELAVRDRAEIRTRVQVLGDRATRAARQAILLRRRRLEGLVAKYGFRRQRDVLDAFRQRVDEALRAMRVSVGRALETARRRLEATVRRYGFRHWPEILHSRREAVERARRRLIEAGVNGVVDRRRRLGALTDRLRALSPHEVLARGFCIARGPDGTLLRAADTLTIGDLVALEFASGEADARVEQIRRGETDGSR